MGYLLDRAIDTRPWFMLLGLLIGLGAVLYAFWLKVNAEAKKRP